MLYLEDIEIGMNFIVVDVCIRITMRRLVVVSNPS